VAGRGFTLADVDALALGQVLDTLWQRMCGLWFGNWWDTDDSEAFERAFCRREDALAELEFAVLQTSAMAYQALAEGIATCPPLTDDPAERRLLVIFDGLSVREGCFLWERLQREGCQVEMGYTFSNLPAETSTFCQHHFGVSSAKALVGRSYHGLPAAYAADETRVAEELPRGEGGLLWIGIPDPLMEGGKKGAKTILEPLEAWRRTWQAMAVVLEGAGGREIWVTSDHGYIYRGPNYSDRFWSLGNTATGRWLRDLFGGGRHKADLELDNELATSLRDYVWPDPAGGYAVKGRWLWPMPGQTGATLHEGLSLVECLVPVLRIKAQ
jgi:hypothetical protein